MSGVTIPDMVRIALRHGVRVVPLDIEVETLLPTLEVGR